MIKEYWFYLETYVFLWSNSQEILLYNTLSGKGYLYSYAPELKPLVAQLEDKSNLYCITINETDLQNPAIRDFISSVRENFCGDLLDKSIFKQKPLVVIPELNVNEETYTGVETVKRDIASGIHAVKNLLELTVYLIGICDLDCKDCHNIYKQLTWCFKNRQVLPKELLFDILNQTRDTSVCEIKFTGGNVFTYPFWDEMIDELKKYSFKKSFYIDYRLLPSNHKQLEIFEEDKGFCLFILVDVSNNLEKTGIDNITVNQKYNYIFKINSINEFEIAKSIINKYQIESKIIPFYNGRNLQFFEENIFQDLDDILNTHWRKNEVFAHTVLNTNDFGKFIVLPDGKIYANVNFERVGDIKSDNIKVLVNQELKDGKSWMLTRNKVTPCKNCLYKYLCPSISNYETAIGKNNLCHVNN